MLTAEIEFEKNAEEYPRLVRANYSSMVVLLSGPTTGTVIANATGTNFIGQHSTSWERSIFHDVRGSITLRQGR